MTCKTDGPLALMENTQTPFHPDQPSHITYMQHPQPKNYVQQPPFNTNYKQQPMPNPKDISDPTTAIDMELILMAKAFKLNNTTSTNNNQRNNVGKQFRPNAGQIVGNQNGYNAMQNVRNQVGQNAVQNPNVQKIANHSRNGNVIAARAEKMQASTLGTQTDKAPVYDSDGSPELSKEKTTASYLKEERKILKDDFNTPEDEFLDKLIQAEKKIKELNKILVKMGQLIQTMHMLSPKTNSFYHTEHKISLGYQNPFYLKQAYKKKQGLYNGIVLLDKHNPPVVYDLEETLQLAQESRLINNFTKK
ncbi:hypothetical protein Tco_1114264 [Tanacetum coccineum]|uniref:Uncharacterized protein n=1 Tax=Tanacetum coccineum TaxID=301880 RepID=A0ABQ5IUK3_9ASTR